MEISNITDFTKITVGTKLKDYANLFDWKELR